MRRIVGNLLWEEELAGRRRTPPRSVLDTAAGLATLLRAFAEDGDRLWTPAPVAPERVVDVPGLPRPILESGPLRELPPAGEVLAWGAGSPVAAAVHHREFCLRVARETGRALPGARMVESAADLDRVLATPGAPRAWVVKAPLSAAGRGRHVERDGPALADPKARRTVARLFEVHGSLLFEPWLDRTADFGVSVQLDGEELRIVGLHGQRVDARGQFQGIDLRPALSGAERDLLLETAEVVAAALRRAGYAGPFGIDAWRYRRADGTEVLHPLGEINARLTFGRVAWTLAERVAGMAGLTIGPRIPAGAVPLFLPGPGPGAWLEIS